MINVEPLMAARDEPNIPGFGLHQNVQTDRGFARTFRTPLKSMGLERSNSKVLILKPNMQVIVVNGFENPGLAPGNMYQWIFVF